MSAELMKHSTPIARKIHKCACCFGIIPRTTRYVNQTILDDGFQTLKMHSKCFELLIGYSEYHALDGDDGMPDWHEVLRWQQEANT